MIVTDPSVPSPHRPTASDPADERLRAVALQLEASFLATMLASAGSGQARDAFGGGAGEEQFSSFLTTETARALVDRGGFGLAESLFDALKARTDVR